MSVVSTVAALHVLAFDVSDALFDFFLPDTDREVFIQWGVAAVFWPLPLWWARKQNRDLKHFVWGVAVMNLAWFGARMIH